jgi:hypothetical protein
MLKKLLLVVIFAGITFTASAQYLSEVVGADPIKGHTLTIRYAAKAGLNMTTASSSSKILDFSMGAGFQIGAACNIRWGYRSEYSRPGTGILACQPEILYSFQSVTLPEGVKLNMNRISIPLMLRAYPISSVYCELGPDFSYLFSTSPDKVIIGSCVNSVGQCAGFATDIALGAGWESKMGYLVGVRYGLGLNALAKNLPWRTHNLSLSVGWMF